MNLRWAILVTPALILAGGWAGAELEVLGTSPPSFEVLSASETNPEFQRLVGLVNPWGLDCHVDSGLVYLSDPTAGRIQVVNPNTAPPKMKTILSRPEPGIHGIELDEAHNRLFFLDSADDSVNVLDLASLVATPLIAGKGIIRPNDLAYDPVRNWILFTDSGTDALRVIDDEGNAIGELKEAATDGAWGVAVHPRTGEIYFSSFVRGEILLVDKGLTTPKPVVTGLDGPRGLEFDRHGRLFCMESGKNRVVQIDLGAGTVAKPEFATAHNGRAFVIFDDRDKDGDFLVDDWERRFVTSICDLNAASDPDGDGKTAFNELLFNGSPLSSADEGGIRSYGFVAGGGLSVTFEGPPEGYEHQVLFSSDLENWVSPPAGALMGMPLAGDPLFWSWEATIDPVALGLDPAQVFVRAGGMAEGP